MAQIVGIPRAMLYYQYYPMWKTFFEALGAEVVVSGTTKKTTLAAGSARVVAETCLPTKVFCGHVIDLADKADCIFIPSIRSIEARVYNCSKFLGLPDLVRATVRNAPPIIDPDFDVNQGKRAMGLAVYEAGRRFSWNPFKIKEAAELAWQSHHRYVAAMKSGLNPPEAIEKLTGEPDEDWHRRPSRSRYAGAGIPSSRLKIALIGHPYNIYDNYITHNMFGRLEGMGVDVLTPDTLSDDDLGSGIVRLVGRPYWTYEGEVVGAAGHYLFDEVVDGVVAIFAFGCGPDSTMMDVVQRAAKKSRRKPYMALTIDEHSGEAGLITRLEAFVDMLQRRSRQKAS
ncbi:MAG: acyl-CoA dehydratase activase-related protein [Chloroflexi bacterium]|nr:acyl-CoA dehydratase activase-related protein [Chloroflexota bacterium]